MAAGERERRVGMEALSREREEGVILRDERMAITSSADLEPFLVRRPGQDRSTCGVGCVVGS